MYPSILASYDLGYMTKCIDAYDNKQVSMPYLFLNNVLIIIGLEARFRCFPSYSVFPGWSFTNGVDALRSQPLEKQSDTLLRRIQCWCGRSSVQRGYALYGDAAAITGFAIDTMASLDMGHWLSWTKEKWPACSLSRSYGGAERACFIT